MQTVSGISCVLLSFSLCCGATLPAQDEEPLEKRVAKALDRSRPALLAHLRNAQGGVLALLCLAAAHDDVSVKNKIFAAALRRLARTKLTRTYDLSLRLMVMANLPSYAKRTTAAPKDAKRLLENRNNLGGFSYTPRTRWDLSNTQYAALGLRAAANLGAKIAERQWRGIALAAISAQSDDGGFTYSTSRARRKSKSNSYSSMTVAGIAVLRICMQHLPDKAVANLELPRRIEEAWDWMAEHKDDIGERRTRSCLYFHYGLERACILSDVKDVDGKDWYRSGAEMLLKMQLRLGGWHSTSDMHGGGGGKMGKGSPVSTAFAILFLRRKFRKMLGPITPGGGVRVAHLSALSDKRAVDAAVQGEVGRGKSAVPDLLKALRSAIGVRRKAALQALIRITGKDFGYNPHQGPEQNAEAIKRAERWWLKSRNG